MKKLLFIGLAVSFVAFFAACGGGNSNKNNSNSDDSAQATENNAAASAESENPPYDPHRGEGKFNDYEAGPFNAALAAKGQEIYSAKCQACHKLTDERLVGPGWKGVSKKHSAAWILNFLTNTDAMLDQDPELQKQLEICMVRMPNQNLSDDDAKAVYDFMRENDGAK